MRVSVVVRSTYLKLALATLLLAGAVATNAAAAPGDLDPSFGKFGKQLISSGDQSYGNDVAVQSDGRIVVEGGLDNGSTVPASVFGFRANGRPDTSFGDQGTVALPGGSGTPGADALVLQPDGKIVIASISTAGALVLFRLAPDGTLDPSFGSGGVADPYLQVVQGLVDVALTADAKIVVTATAAGSESVLVARLLSDGSLDPSFSNDGVATTGIGQGGQAVAVAAGPGDEITVAGRTAGFGPATLVRYRADGSLDPAFGSAGVASALLDGTPGSYFDLSVRPDGGAVVVGFLNQRNIVPVIASFTPAGILDTSFAGDGAVEVGGGEFGVMRSVELQSDGSIVGVGVLDDEILVARYSANGTADSSFGREGLVTTSFGNAIADGRTVALQADGKIVVAGERITGFRSTESQLGLARFLVAPGPHDADADGVPDSRDRCKGLAATGHRGCPLFKRTVALRHSAKGVSGKVKSAKRPCRSAGSVSIYAAKPGADERLGRRRLSGVPFSIPLPGFEGRVYARLREFLDESVGLCGATRSKPISVG